MANYKVNISTKTVTIDMDNVTSNEMKLVQTYVAAGYILKEKRKGLKYDDMKKALKSNEAALKELDNKIAAKENYMIIKKWFQQQTKKSK